MDGTEANDPDSQPTVGRSNAEGVFLAARVARWDALKRDGSSSAEAIEYAANAVSTALQ